MTAEPPEIRRYGLQPAGADELAIVGRTKPAAMVDRDIAALRFRPAKQRLAPAAQLDAGGERIAVIAPAERRSKKLASSRSRLSPGHLRRSQAKFTIGPSGLG
jgi:hypothetical protein